MVPPASESLNRATVSQDEHVVTLSVYLPPVCISVGRRRRRRRRTGRTGRGVAVLVQHGAP